ncbi:MAG: hypothetical protein ACREDM_07415 [Methylocella sp.]
MKSNVQRLAFAWLALAVAVASDSPAVACDGNRQCKRGASECPILLDLHPNQTVRVVTGRLSPKRPNFSYAFAGRDGQTFSWKYSGPAVRVLLAYPDGTTDGPGLDPDINLVKQGTYIFSISSNTMADKIYGYFKLQFKLKSNQ